MFLYKLFSRSQLCSKMYLVCVQEQESNHEREQTSSFGESESENGVREQLT